LQNLLHSLTSPWVVGPLVFIIWCIGLSVIMRVLYGRIRRLAAHTTTDIDDVILGALRGPVVLVVLVTGGLILARILPISPEWDKGLNLGVRIAVILAGVLFVDGLIKALLHRASRKAAFLKTSSGIVQTAVRGIIILIALLIVLDTAGVSITPLVASLGVGSLAVALALQSPLANFFAGIQILADKPIEVGQYIELDSGHKGYVTKIGWRSTTIKILPNNLVIVPNSTIMSAIITNYYLPEKQLSILVEVGVHYDSDLEHVERVTCEVAKSVLEEVEGGKKDFEPFIRYHTFGDFSINFTVILRVEEFVNGYLIKHEFIKRLHKRFNQEGIVIPFPIRSLDINREDLVFLKQDGPSG
jgi:small-conductance mechanosensitive channel